MLCACISLSPHVPRSIVLAHGSRGTHIARVSLDETFRLNTQSNIAVVRVLVPSGAGLEPTFIDYGTAIFHLSQGPSTMTSELMYHSTNEVACIQNQEARVTLRIEECQLDSVARRSETHAGVSSHSDIDQYLALMSNWWSRVELPALSQIRGSDGMHVVPGSNVHPWVLGTFDLHAPHYGVASSHLPGWAFALPLCDDCDPLWLDYLVRLAGARVGCSADSMNAMASDYLAKKSKDEPFNPSSVVELLFDACALPAPFMPYASDVSTGRSAAPIERYSLTPRYGASGDCEDGAKMIQTVFENFAALSDNAPVSLMTKACADMARRYVGGLSVVAANAGSFGARSRAFRNSLDPAEVEKMGYSDFVSHMTFVAIPKFQVSRRGVSGNARAQVDPRAPERLWESMLLPIVLEGTGMKSSRADAESHGGPLLSKQNGMAMLKKAPFHALADTSNAFYIIMISVSFARGVDYVDAQGQTCPIHEIFFAANHHGNEITYGVQYDDLISADGSWVVCSTLYKTGVTCSYVKEKQETLRQILSDRGVLPLCSLSVPDPAPFAQRAEKLFRDMTRERNVEYESVFAPNMDNVIGAQGFVYATSLTENAAREIISTALRMGKKMFWNVEAIAPWHWGVRFVVK